MEVLCDMYKQTISKIFGIIFILGAIYIVIAGVSNYTNQLEQRDWRVVMAVVTDVTQRRQSTGLRHNHYKTVYDVTYEYNFNGDSYTGKIIGTVTRREIGDMFDVKCNPDAPENSTHILELQPDALAANLFGACLFAAVGLSTSGLWEYFLNFIKSKKAKKV